MMAIKNQMNPGARTTIKSYTKKFFLSRGCSKLHPQRALVAVESVLASGCSSKEQVGTARRAQEAALLPRPPTPVGLVQARHRIARNTL